MSTRFAQSTKKASFLKAQALSIGGSVVEFSPATREARVRFPANAVAFAASGSITCIPLQLATENPLKLSRCEPGQYPDEGELQGKTKLPAGSGVNGAGGGALTLRSVRVPMPQYSDGDAVL